MPYLDETGKNVLLTRSRVSITGKPKVKTRKGDKHRLYGLWKLEEARKAGYVWLIEGESDTQTLLYHGEPAAGIPGANGWKAEWALDLAGIDCIYFVVEDEAGEACWRKLAATPELQEQLYRVELPEDTEILPTPKDLEKEMSGCTIDSDLGEIEHPPPSSTRDQDTLAAVRELFAKDSGKESR